jgi:general L-amino acid transport system substrate-binding protein
VKPTCGRCVAAALVSLLALPLHAESIDRIDRIIARGELNCGVLPGVAGFAAVDRDGHYSGFDIDTCRAVASAVLGQADKVRFVTAASVAQLDSDPDLDLVVRRLTWTLTREAALKLLFGPVTFYDGQGFLVPKSSGLSTPASFSGIRICVDSGEDWVRHLSSYLKTKAIAAKLVVTSGRNNGEMLFFSRQCDVYSADQSMLGAIRADAAQPADYMILPEMISEEPLAPLVRQGDDRFFLVVRWTIFAIIEAEALGITSKNVDASRQDPNLDIARLLGRIPGNGKALGLAEDWAYRVIKNVGNYGEIFDRDIGAGSPIKLDRGFNRLWTEGGLMYAPPVR